MIRKFLLCICWISIPFWGLAHRNIACEKPNRQVEVQFISEGDMISGTLWLPEGDGPFPALVLGHGSGKSTRHDAGFAAKHFSENGVAFLTYDKRGVGNSEGTYVGRNNVSKKNLKLLAKDIAAGVSYLKSRNDIVAKQVGLWGVSQAGWILPIAANIVDELLCTILISGPTVTVGEEAYYSNLTGNDGSMLRGTNKEQISKLLAAEGPSGFDPLPYLEKMGIPGLWILGEDDMSIPVLETTAHLDKLIEKGHKFKYVVFPNASHSLRVNGMIVDDYWQVQDAFVENILENPVSN